VVIFEFGIAVQGASKNFSFWEGALAAGFLPVLSFESRKTGFFRGFPGEIFENSSPGPFFFKFFHKTQANLPDGTVYGVEKTGLSGQP
jgi:hypothetical protein